MRVRSAKQGRASTGLKCYHSSLLGAADSLAFLISAIVTLFLLAQPVNAHPVPADNHDRYLLVRITPSAVVVDYRLEVDKTRAEIDLPASEKAKIFQGNEELEAIFCRYFGDVLTGNLAADVDGKQLEFRCVSHRYTKVDDLKRSLGHLRCEYRMEAAWDPRPAEVHKLKFREANYEYQDFCRLQLSLSASDLISLQTVVVPDADLLARNPRDFQPGDAERLRNVTATFRLTPATPVAWYKPSLPPDFADLKSEPRDAGATTKEAPAVGAPAASTKEAPPAGWPVAAAKRSPAAPEEVPPTPVDDARNRSTNANAAESWSLLNLFLNSKQGIVILLLGAAAFGAIHALTPGHGKTLVAAYLVGERGTAWHAILLGIVTTVTHTAAVILIAIALLFFPQTNLATLHIVLEFAGGLLVLSLGLWLLYTRLTGRADHVHLGTGHHHHHHHGDGHHHDHHHHDAVSPETAGEKPSTWALVLLGFKGGMVPCWDAIAMLTIAISAGRLWLALPLLLAFSAGLAGVLTGLGIAVVHARKFAGNRLQGGDRFQRIFRTLPLVSATAITLVGMWLCYDGLHPR